MGAIYRREMYAFFTSGLAYVFLSGYFLFSGYFFYAGSLASATTDTSAMFGALFLVVLFLIPILTMRLLSEEKKNKTDQGLLTAPVGLWSIVLGKYLAAFTLFVIAESIVFIYAMFLSYFGTVTWSTLLGNYFAMLLLGAAFIAVGTFISSLTENQMASAVREFRLHIVFKLLPEKSAMIIDTDTVTVKSKSGDRIQKTSGKSAKSAVSERRLRFAFLNF